MLGLTNTPLLSRSPEKEAFKRRQKLQQDNEEETDENEVEEVSPRIGEEGLGDAVRPSWERMASRMDRAQSCSPQCALGVQKCCCSPWAPCVGGSILLGLQPITVGSAWVWRRELLQREGKGCAAS